jgi:flagellar biosynthetic protein FliO
MTGWLLALATPDPSGAYTPELGAGIRGLAAVFLVLGLVAIFAWLLRRGAFGPLGRRASSIVSVETAVPLGERRSVVVVAVEGRRLLLGLAPGQVSLLTELRGSASSFPAALDKAAGDRSQGSL